MRPEGREKIPPRRGRKFWESGRIAGFSAAERTETPPEGRLRRFFKKTPHCAGEADVVKFSVRVRENPDPHRRMPAMQRMFEAASDAGGGPVDHRRRLAALVEARVW